MENENRLCGFVGRDLRKNIPASSFEATLNGDNDYRVITFFTEDNGYAEFAARLEAGLKKYNLEYNLVGIPSIGPWELNCAFKARFVKEQWEKSDKPIVWIDADATIEQNPVLFRKIDCDFAAYNSGYLASGTVYFAKSEYTRRLIDQWLFRCEADPITWDQLSLQFAWLDISSLMPLKTVWLPEPYCAVFDAGHKSKPVVKHWQASRKSKTKGAIARIKDLPEFINFAQTNRLWSAATALSYLGEKTAPPPRVLPQTFYDELGSMVSKFSTVVELGCGEGHLATHFAPDSYTGLEENPRLLAQARKNYPNHYFRCFDPGLIVPKTPTLIFTQIFSAWKAANTAKFLLPASKQADTVIIVDVLDDMAASIRDMEKSGLKIDTIIPMRYKDEATNKPLSVVIMKRRAYSKFLLAARNLINRKIYRLKKKKGHIVDKYFRKLY